MKTANIDDNGKRMVIIKDKTDDDMYVIENLDGEMFSNGQKIRVVNPNLLYDVKEIKLGSPTLSSGATSENEMIVIFKKSVIESGMWLLLMIVLTIISWPYGLIFLIVYGFILWAKLRKNKYFEKLR